ncbi:MAG: T9SS type A sorting domain-containing protein [candidate division Zixibacteria bacterium]|nr:T9SS type A sorting domain-containing protein [candidate division Zixibacteria bacterium]
MKKALILSLAIAVFSFPMAFGAIYDVQFNDTNQGSGDDCFPSPYVDQTVEVVGKVTAVQAGSYPNFYLQADGCEWNGVYVYDDGVAPCIGDSLYVRGTVTEYFGVTEITSVDSFYVFDSGLDVMEPCSLGTDDLAGGCSATAEAWEGVLVALYDVTILTDQDSYGQNWIRDANGIDSIYLDDEMYKYGDFAPNPTPAQGDTYDMIVGVVHYSYGEYRLYPRGGYDFTPAGNVTIAQVQMQECEGNGCFPSYYNGDEVTLSGIVTAVRQGSSPWFWMQDPADTLWSGLYVYDTTVEPEVGDSVTLTGLISEYYGVTEFMDITASTIVSVGNNIDPTYVTTATLDSLCSYEAEQYEGMLVELNDVTVIEGPSSHNECWVQDASGVPVIIDDELWKYGSNQPDPQPAAGMEYEKIVGVVHYAYDAYRVYPRGAEDYTLAQGELLCELTILTPYVQSNGGFLGFQFDVTNNTGSNMPNVWGEIHPTLGDCATGTVFDFDNSKEMTTDLGNGETFTGYYYMTMGNWSNLPNLVALTVEAGDGPNSYYCEDCGEFFFLHEWSRGGEPTWTDQQWLDREDVNIPTETALMQNYPNPFNATTVIPFDLANNGNVSLKVYNLAGQLVETLVDGYMNAGSHNINWDASSVASGVYFYTLQADDYTTTKKLNLLK